MAAQVATSFYPLLFLLVGLACSRLAENEVCTVQGNESTCKKINDCPSAIAAIKAGTYPPVCTFSGMTPIVCCPIEPGVTSISVSETTLRTTTLSTTSHNLLTSSQPGQPLVTSQPQVPIFPEEPTQPSTSPTTGSKARNKCLEYARTVLVKVESPLLIEGGEDDVIDTCVRVETPLIVGGKDTIPKEFPHMALIGYGEVNPQWLCGGSLISERFVLSAAHCSNPGRKGPAKWVKLGELDTSTDFDDARPVTLKIVERFDHPAYSSVTLYNDITLFKLERDVQINAYIRPICLRTDDEIEWKTAIATGWGHTFWGGVGSEHLKKVTLNLVSTENCNNTYKKSIGRQIPQGILHDSMLCAGDEQGKDTCQGDSGGPLQIPLLNPYCMFDLIGVTSFGKTCGNKYPGVYTRISHFVPWIENIVWP